MNRVHFSSKSAQWSTPQWLYDLLDAEFGFTLDVCAESENAKCARFYSPADDGLKQSWSGVLWMNPPYGRKISRWVEKAYGASLAGATVVCLIPARTDTVYWHRVVTKAHEFRFLKGRLKFGNAGNSAPFPSAILIFKAGNHQKPRIRFVDLAEVQRTLFGC
jgi:site-specific DNA-methyltransferase (adenine-specific)